MRGVSSPHLVGERFFSEYRQNAIRHFVRVPEIDCHGVVHYFRPRPTLLRMTGRRA